jgi:hypothetical protein
MRTMIGGICLVLVFVCLGTSPVRAAVLDDHFDDGNLATNTTGTGTGFIPYVQATGSVTEVPSEALFTSASGSLLSLYSTDNLDLFTANGTKTTFQISSGSVAGGVPFDFPAGDNGRIWFGLVTSTTNTGNFALPISSTPDRHGLWVSLYDVIPSQATLGTNTNPNDYNGQIGWVAADGTRTVLGQFTYNSYLLNDPAHDAIDMHLTVSATSYGVSFSGPDSGVTLQTGAMSGNLPSAASGLFKLAVGFQSGQQTASSSLGIDRIIVDVVPEPTSLAMLWLGVALIGGFPIRLNRTRG